MGAVGPVLDRHPTWKHVNCPNCGKPARRETDTLDTFVDSSWYFLRFASQPGDRPFDPEVIKQWLPVEQYIGGIEHAILHLLYARFWHKVLFDLGYVDSAEPFHKLFNQGMIQAYAYTDDRGQYVPAAEVVEGPADANGEPTPARAEEKPVSSKVALPWSAMRRLRSAETATLLGPRSWS